MAQTTQTITVQIGNRTYPLAVPATEQEVVLKATHEINRQLEELGKKYRGKDQQDLLAMCLLQNVTEYNEGKSNHASTSDELALQVTKIDAMVTDYLEAIERS